MARKRMHTPAQISTFLAELESQTDRGAALIAAAVLDELLEIVIQARLIEVGSDRREALFGPTKPLASFSSKIELGFALGIYSNVARIQLDMIRDVRNKFAHRIEAITFNHPKIAREITSRRTENMATDISIRQQFLSTFSAIAAVLYGTTSADIRIKSLGETHVDLYLRLALAAKEIQEARNKKA